MSAFGYYKSINFEHMYSQTNGSKILELVIMY